MYKAKIISLITQAPFPQKHGLSPGPRPKSKSKPIDAAQFFRDLDAGRYYSFVMITITLHNILEQSPLHRRQSLLESWSVHKHQAVKTFACSHLGIATDIPKAPATRPVTNTEYRPSEKNHAKASSSRMLCKMTPSKAASSGTRPQKNWWVRIKPGDVLKPSHSPTLLIGWQSTEDVTGGSCSDYGSAPSLSRPVRTSRLRHEVGSLLWIKQIYPRVPSQNRINLLLTYLDSPSKEVRQYVENQLYANKLWPLPPFVCFQYTSLIPPQDLYDALRMHLDIDEPSGLLDTLLDSRDKALREVGKKYRSKHQDHAPSHSQSGHPGQQPCCSLM